MWIASSGEGGKGKGMRARERGPVETKFLDITIIRLKTKHLIPATQRAN